MQAIILCGGKGTRLKSALPKGLPKAMADVNGKPFLHYLMEYWEPYIDRFVLAVGYGQNKIRDYFGGQFKKSELLYVSCIDGTATAVEQCLPQIGPLETFVINGDTYFELNILAMWQLHRSRGEHITMGYSWAAGIHAGVDIIEKNSKSHTRGAIYSSSGFFCDIGTPERLNTFREYMKGK